MKNRCSFFIIVFICVVCFLSPTVNPAIGAAIKDTESATHGTGAADYTIVDTYTFPSFRVIQFELPVLSIYSYLLISGDESLVIDPGRDIQMILDIAKKEKTTIKGVYVSHSHADFIAGHLETANAAKCPVYQSSKSGAAYRFKPVKENSIINVGNAAVRFIETPGHTPDAMCALVSSGDGDAQPEVVFTGDVLFVGSVGRPDLMEGSSTAAWLASAMYNSWTQKISRLPDEVRVFPAHGAGSLCGAHLSDEPFSTVGKERSSNPYLQQKGRGAFIAALLEGLPEAPQYFKHNARINREGPPLVSWNARLPAEIKPGKALTDPSRYYIVDLRDAVDYAAGHVPNSVNIGLRGRLETWVGIMVPWEANLVLVGSEPELAEATYRLHRVGYKPGIMTIETWKKAGLPVNKTLPVGPAELYRQMEAGTAPVVIDVRLPSEWMALRIGTVLNMPLNRLDRLCRQLDASEAVVAVCNSAYRSSLAVGVLERSGFKQPMSLDGGSEAWIKASLPVFEATKPGAGGAAGVAKKYIRLPERISGDDLNRMIMDLPGTFDLIDIRPPAHFTDFNLPGSRNVDVADAIGNTAFLVGPSPLVLVDRDGSVAMAIGGILSQKTERPIKVLFGGLEAYWSGQSGAMRQSIALPAGTGAGVAPAADRPPQTAPQTSPPPQTQPAAKRKSAGC